MFPRFPPGFQVSNGAALDPSRPSCSWTNLSIGIDTNNRVTATGFSYDAAGNVLADGSNSYTWDAESELKTAAGVTYTYDGDGRRVQKSNGKLYWYGATGDILDESDASGNITDEFVFFDGRRIARRNIATGNIYYYLADHLGTARMIVQAGQTSACYDADFDPFGGEHIVTNTCPQNYKFTGKERDTESGLDDFDARYYSSQFGRFHSADWSAIPIPVPYPDLGNPQTLNLYAYVKNNPLNLTDPTGHQPEGALVGTGGDYMAARMRDTGSALGCAFDGGCTSGSITIGWELTVNGEATGETFTDFAAATATVAALNQSQPQNNAPRLGIGVEVPANSAVHNNILDVTADPGHAFVYLKDSSGNVTSTLSFGPGGWIAANLTAFQNGQLPGNANWPIKGSVSTWESTITSAQFATGTKAIADFKGNVPNYTMAFNCTTAALSIAQKVGLTLPSGVGPVTALGHNQTVANPFHLSQQMRSQFGPPQIVGASVFAPPKW